jgi:hypothetical protein
MELRCTYGLHRFVYDLHHSLSISLLGYIGGICSLLLLAGLCHHQKATSACTEVYQTTV